MVNQLPGVLSFYFYFLTFYIFQVIARPNHKSCQQYPTSFPHCYHILVAKLLLVSVWLLQRDKGHCSLQYGEVLSLSLLETPFPEDLVFHRIWEPFILFNLSSFVLSNYFTHDLAKHILSGGFCLSVSISIGFPVDFYGKKTVMFLRTCCLSDKISNNLPWTFSYSLNCRIKSEEDDWVLLLSFFSQIILNYFFTTFCMVLIFSFNIAQAGVCLTTGSIEA